MLECHQSLALRNKLKGKFGTQSTALITPRRRSTDA
jgi:hypothetical protein